MFSSATAIKMSTGWRWNSLPSLKREGSSAVLTSKTLSQEKQLLKTFLKQSATAEKQLPCLHQILYKVTGGAMSYRRHSQGYGFIRLCLLYTRAVKYHWFFKTGHTLTGKIAMWNLTFGISLRKLWDNQMMEWTDMLRNFQSVISWQILLCNECLTEKISKWNLTVGKQLERALRQPNDGVIWHVTGLPISALFLCNEC